MSSAPFRVGQGFDVHAFCPNRKLILAGIEIPHNLGLQGHSDADVLTHAICDAILGAFALGDIGKWFPDTSDKFKDINSLFLLKEILQSSDLNEWQLGNLDSTIVAQKPKLAPYIDDMRLSYTKLFNCDLSQISVKATTTEKLGFTGREEGIAAYASVLFTKKNNT